MSPLGSDLFPKKKIQVKIQNVGNLPSSPSRLVVTLNLHIFVIVNRFVFDFT